MATTIISSAAKRAIKRTRDIIDRYGPRLAGTQASLHAAQDLRGEYDTYCHRTILEEFTVRPNAFLGFLKVSSTVYALSALMLFFGFNVTATLGFTFASVMATSQFICYKELFDPLYKKKTGYNVSGIIEPAGSVLRQIIISGHHDSAYEFRYMTHNSKLYRIRLILIIASLLLSPVAAFVVTVFSAINGPAGPVVKIVTWAVLGSIFFILPMFFFLRDRGTPGAGDNLIASSITVELARMFGKKSPAHDRLQHTRIILCSFDAEESGLRGSRAYARMHRDDLSSVPTWHFNMDSLYYADRIKFLTRDLNGFVKLSEETAKDCTRIARSLGYGAETFAMYPGTGATDAAELAKIGVKATTLIALPTEVEKEESVYHTQGDTVDSIEPVVVEAAIAIAAGFIREKDD